LSIRHPSLGRISALRLVTTKHERHQDDDDNQGRGSDDGNIDTQQATDEGFFPAEAIESTKERGNSKDDRPGEANDDRQVGEPISSLGQRFLDANC
jgi:hypothetical protein